MGFTSDYFNKIYNKLDYRRFFTEMLLLIKFNLVSEKIVETEQ